MENADWKLQKVYMCVCVKIGNQFVGGTTRHGESSRDASFLFCVESLLLSDSAQKPSVTTQSSGTSRYAHSCPERVIPLWDDSLYLASVTTRYAVTTHYTVTSRDTKEKCINFSKSFLNNLCKRNEEKWYQKPKIYWM